MSTNIRIRRCSTYEEMLPHFHLVKLLSPTITEYHYQQNLKDMIPRAYFQVVAEENGLILGLSGYHIGTKFYCGKYLEVDNFIVEPSSRGRGIGKILHEWMESEAKLLGCRVLMLDAYLENEAAHRFYRREGYVAKGYHFIKALS
jgi:GNAT superfamily N-acetyltransferase